MQLFGNTIVAASAFLGLVFNLDSNTLGMAVSFSLQASDQICNFVTDCILRSTLLLFVPPVNPERTFR